MSYPQAEPAPYPCAQLFILKMAVDAVSEQWEKQCQERLWVESESCAGKNFLEKPESIEADCLAKPTNKGKRLWHEYDCTVGVAFWPSRDPIQEWGGLNLYGFVGNNGVNVWDLFGLHFEKMEPFNREKCIKLKNFSELLKEHSAEMIKGFDEFRELINYVRNTAYAQISLGFLTGAVSVIRSVVVVPAQAASKAGAKFVPGTTAATVVQDNARNLARNQGIVSELISNSANVGASFFLYSNSSEWAGKLLDAIDVMSSDHHDAVLEMQKTFRAAKKRLENEPCCKGI